ncbi:hypothetical protein [Clostridium perfringens]|nr:hypothetical protein [Clostridium perfringens]
MLISKDILESNFQNTLVNTKDDSKQIKKSSCICDHRPFGKRYVTLK